MKQLYSFHKLYKLSFKKNPLTDFKKFEAYFALLCAIIITLINYFVIKTNELIPVLKLQIFPGYINAHGKL